MQTKQFVEHLDQIERNYQKYAYYYSEYPKVQAKFKIEKDLREKEEKEFQEQIKVIIKEFEQFHLCFEKVQDEN